MSAPDFDARARAFTEAMQIAAGWKHNFFGAAYSTRLVVALEGARAACDDLERLLREDGALLDSPLGSEP